MRFGFEHSYKTLPRRFYADVRATLAPAPRLLVVNATLASFLKLDPQTLTTPDSIASFAGNAVPDDAQPIALAYAGHQFGHFVPQLGDGRAMLLGEIVATDGRRYDVQLKGAGPTPFSRGGDGRAAIGPVLREYLLSEAMAALGVPTTRALAAVATGDAVHRDEILPGAVFTRVAASHLRVGTFEYFAARQDEDALERLVRYALDRHYPNAAAPDGPALALFDAVMAAQLRLVARWLSVGFVHGVMNTDNFSISGETLDYGPAAFLDSYHPQRKFSSIDRNGRYAFGEQPKIAAWNLSRFAETLIPVMATDEQAAIEALTQRLRTFEQRFADAWAAELRKKLGLFEAREGDLELGVALLSIMAEARADYTRVFRQLTLGREDVIPSPAFSDWVRAWRARQAQEQRSNDERATLMRSANPAYIPRNHAVEHALQRAKEGDLAPFERLLKVLARPFDEQDDTADLQTPPGEEQWGYKTFCGT